MRADPTVVGKRVRLGERVAHRQPDRLLQQQRRSLDDPHGYLERDDGCSRQPLVHCAAASGQHRIYGHDRDHRASSPGQSGLHRPSGRVVRIADDPRLIPLRAIARPRAAARGRLRPAP
jgi:hypothetical protein